MSSSGNHSSINGVTESVSFYGMQGNTPLYHSAGNQTYWLHLSNDDSATLPTEDGQSRVRSTVAQEPFDLQVTNIQLTGRSYDLGTGNSAEGCIFILPASEVPSGDADGRMISPPAEPGHGVLIPAHLVTEEIEGIVNNAMGEGA